MKEKFIAVVTPVYNGEKFILNSINSLLKQTYTNWVNIIVNDGSTDNTKKVLESFSSDQRFIIINLDKNVGRGAARKIALAKVIEIKATYMCMLDADDIYYPDKLQWQYDYMEQNNNISLLSCSLGIINSKSELVSVLETSKEDSSFFFSNFKDYIPVPHASSIIRVKDIGSHTFDEELLLGQDQDFMIRMLQNCRYSFIPRIGYLYKRIDGFSLKKYKRTLHFAFKSKEKLGFKKSELIKIKISNAIKISIVVFLSFFNKEELYIQKTGRTPNFKEIDEYENYKKHLME